MFVEREQILSEAISTAKEHVRQKEVDATRSDSRKMRPFTSTQLLARGFKRPSKEALKEGKARLLMEDMIYRAEKKLMELKRKIDNSKSNTKVLAEDLTRELFHRPGSLLKKSELDLLFKESECAESRREVPSCDEVSINTYRTYDGTCNNLQNPLQGAARTPFRRLIAPFYEDGISSLQGTLQFSNLNPPKGGDALTKSGPFDPPSPSPRLISKQIVRNDSTEERFLTHITMQWGQFLDHDLDLGPEVEEECEECRRTEVCEPIRVPPNDPAFSGENNQGKESPNWQSFDENNCIPFRRSLLACTENTRGSFSPSEQINDLTSYLDGSQVYGSSEEVARSLRTFTDGLLKTSMGGKNLPLTTEDCLMNLPTCFLAGDIRSNEQVGLTSMHTLWVREHNRIARVLKRGNPTWNDERLYQDARKIVGAMMQKITYKDYLPLVFGGEFYSTLVPEYRGYDRTVDASIPNSFATGAYRYGHSLVRPVFARFLSDLYERGTNRPLNLVNSFFNQKSFLETSLGAVFRGLVFQNSLEMDESVNSVLTTQLFQRPGGRGLDLAALNIQRQRDHGMAPYTVWRNFCQTQFRTLPLADIENDQTLIQLLKVYGDLENIDFWLGGITEEGLKGGVVGPTFACIQGLTFQNLRDGDRFWYENPGIFTQQQRQEIEKASLSRVICDNTDVNAIQPNAFLSNQKRVTCDSLPQVNLARWGEQRCHVRVNHNGGNGVRILLLYVVNRVYHCSSGRDVLGTTPTCIPIQCPSDSLQENLYIFPRTWRGRRRCNRLTVNSQLPVNAQRFVSSCYLGKSFSQSLIDSNSGIYSSLAACQSGSAAAVTYSCGARSEYTTTSQSSTSTMNDGDDENSDCTSPTANNCTLPFQGIDGSSQAKVSIISDLEMALTNEEEKSSKEEQDANLMKKLQETLQKLE